jgi:hypothetical protein
LLSTVTAVPPVSVIPPAAVILMLSAAPLVAVEVASGEVILVSTFRSAWAWWKATSASGGRQE